MPVPTDALKGLSSMLFLIGAKHNGNAVIQEVECLAVDGYKVLAAANSDTEIGLVAAGLGKAGLADGAVLADFQDCYLALRNAEDSRGWLPKLRSKGAKWWPDSDSLDAAGLKALGAWQGWDAGLDAYLLDYKTPAKKQPEGFGKTAADLEAALTRGYRRLGAPVGGTPVADAGKWAAHGPDGAVEGGDRFPLKLVKTTTHTGQAHPLHAEQSLTYAFALFLKAGNPAATVSVAGQKKPCAACEPVLAAFTAAYQHAYGATFNRDQNPRQKASSKANSGTLVLPAADGASEQYGALVAKYKELMKQ